MLLLERAHLLGDRSLGDVQFLRGASERRMTRNRLEGAQRVERRQSVKGVHSLAVLYHGRRKNDSNTAGKRLIYPSETSASGSN